MQAGKQRHKVKFFETPSVPDGAGGTIPGEPVLVLETFATVKQIRSAQVIEAFQVQFGAGYFLSIRDRAGFTINKAYTVEYGGRKMVIKGQANDRDQKHRELTFVCEYVG